MWWLAYSIVGLELLNYWVIAVDPCAGYQDSQLLSITWWKSCQYLSHPGGLHGYYRRGAAYLALGKFKETLKDFSYLVQSMLCQVISLSDRWPHSPSMERMQQMTWYRVKALWNVWEYGKVYFNFVQPITGFWHKISSLVPRLWGSWYVYWHYWTC